MSIDRTRLLWVHAGGLVTIGALAIAVGGLSAAARRPSVTVNGAFYAISTGDFDRAVAWYCENLEFRVDRSGTTRSGVRAAILSRPAALLEVLQLPDAKPRKAWGIPDEPESVHGILKIGFEVVDIDRLYVSARQRGLRVFGGLGRPDGSRLRTFGLKDPDGNIVQFFGK